MIRNYFKPLLARFSAFAAKSSATKSSCTSNITFCWDICRRLLTDLPVPVTQIITWRCRCDGWCHFSASDSSPVSLDEHLNLANRAYTPVPSCLPSILSPHAPPRLLTLFQPSQPFFCSMIPDIMGPIPCPESFSPPTSASLTSVCPSDLSPVVASSGELSLASLTRSDPPAVCSQGILYPALI